MTRNTGRAQSAHTADPCNKLTRLAWCSSMRPGRPRTWRGPTAEPSAERAWSLPCRTATGTPPPYLCGLRVTGPVAPLVLDGAINGRAFRAYVEQMLAPTLGPGDTVVMDNLGSHKVEGVREAIEDRGARLLYPPPYSPDLSPIELAFSKPKRLLRSAAARTVGALWDTIGGLLHRFTPHERTAHFRHCAYARSGQ